jgi:putative flavoprotein involved in K+ transport
MQYVETIVIGGGQAGLATGYQLRKQNRPFVILDTHARIGDAWRQRWDSLRLFSPARFDALDGRPQSAKDFDFITKDEMADYLEAYAREFDLPVQTRTRVTRVSRDPENQKFAVETDTGVTYEADNVIVAMANYQRPRVPTFAPELSDSITQLHAHAYRNPAQLQPGPVLVVGHGNSGAEIAFELAKTHRTYISGKSPGSIPFRIDGLASRLFLSQVIFRGVFHRLLTVDTPMGRKMAKAQARSHTTPLIRVQPGHLEAAGVERVGRTVGIKEGLPQLDDGRILEVSNVVWCTGYLTSFEYLDLPVHGEQGPIQERGICTVEPGLYFVGVHFEYALSSSMVQGVSRDAARVAAAIATSARSRLPRAHASTSLKDERIEVGVPAV